jgi:hypothetical protein
MNLVTREFLSSSGNGSYTALIDTDTGAASCNCRGWIFKRKNKPRGCKHTKVLLSEFDFDPNGGLVLGAANAKPTSYVPAKQSVPEAEFVKAQKSVEKALALVKGKRKIDLSDWDDDEDDHEDDHGSVAIKATPTVVHKKATIPKATSATTNLSWMVSLGSGAGMKIDKAKVISLLNGGAKAPKVKPMLASAMKEDQALDDFISPEWVLEEKYDGHRLTVVRDGGFKVTGWSRPGVNRDAAIRALPAALKSDLAALPVGIYDGELYVPGGTSSDVVRLDKADELRVVLFDVIECMEVDAKDKPLRDRRAVLDLCVEHCPAGGRVHIAPQQPVSLEAVKSIWADKGEGAILKRLDSTYRSGYRTPSWVKVKKVMAAELKIVGFEEGKNGPCSVAKLRHADGRETTVKVLTNNLLADIEADPDRYVGKTMVISHMGLTKSGKWRHPVLDHILGVD